MKEFFRTFVIPKEGKVSDKTFTYNIVLGIVGILLCLTTLTAATWAWFGSSITANNNTIKAGMFSVDVTVSQNDTAISADENGEYTLNSGSYSITLEGQGDVSTGYCTVTLTEADSESSKVSKHTQQVFTSEFANSAEGKVSEISFDLLIKNCDNVKLTIEPCWGTSAKPTEEKIANDTVYIYDGNTNSLTEDETAATPPPADSSNEENSNTEENTN